MSTELQSGQYGLTLDDIYERLHPKVAEAEPVKSRAEIKDSLTPQERDDRKRAGNLVMKVIESGASQDQVVHVDSAFNRGRTSVSAISLAQESLLAHGIITDHEKHPSPANKEYEAQQSGDLSPDIDVLRVTGIDEDRANIIHAKHGR